MQEIGKKATQLSERDKTVYSKIVDARSKHYMARSTALANELAQIRKKEWMMIFARFALEEVLMRSCGLDGSIINWSVLTVHMLRSVRKAVARDFPEVKTELERIEDLLSGIIVEMGISAGLCVDFQELDINAQKILDKAANATQQKVKEDFQGFR